MSTKIRCKFKVLDVAPDYYKQPNDEASVRVFLGAVWEGSSEKQLTENAVFGAMTPQAELNAVFKCRAAERFKVGDIVYATLEIVGRGE